MKLPATRKDDVVEQRFGVAVHDPYRWLEDVKSPEVTAWMSAQDTFARARLATFPDRARLAARLKELYYLERISAPSHKGDRYFYTRTHVDKEKAIVYWREGEDGAERVLIDPNTLSADGTISLGEISVSWDGKQVAYALRSNGSDEATLYVMEVASGKTSTIDVIPGAKYASPSWTPSSDGFYYTRLPVDPTIPIADLPGWSEVRFHKLGDDPKNDALVHEKTGDPTTFGGASLSRDGRWLFYYRSHGWNSDDVWLRDLHDKKHGASWIPFVNGVDAHFAIEAWKDRFYITTNDGAPRYRVMVTDVKHLAKSHWKELVPEDKQAVLDGASVVGGHLAVSWMRNASSEIELRTLEGKLVRKVALPGIGSSSGFLGQPEDDAAYFTFSSYTTPDEIRRTSIKSGETRVWANVKVPVDPAPYLVEQVWFPSKDGTRISMFIIRRRDLVKDGSVPFLLTGYGGFNSSETPYFASTYFPFLEAGGAVAIPNLRGGGEYGEGWHKAGMGANKQNVFDDFIGAAEYLVRERYTSAGKLAIMGGSNGGLLVGAATVQRPELFRAVVCQVPLLDMVRYHLFGSGKTWIEEYGSADKETEFHTLHAYSPYHHVAAPVAYPSLLMMSADSDDRVDPMHARKMVAALQAAQSNGERPILLRIEQHAGHGGADLVKQHVESSADWLAFVMSELGMKG